MAITQKKPPLRESVGSQYICFATSGETQKDLVYETEVEKTDTVKKVKVQENADSNTVYASGILYDTNDTAASTSIEVEVIAFEADTLAKGRGDVITEHGGVVTGGERPYFAYGKVVKMKGGKEKWVWYPKCKLAENSDEAQTSEEKFAEQSDTITILAFPVCGENEKSASFAVDQTMAKFPAGLTEEKFFAKPIFNDAGLAEIISPAL